MKNTKIITLQTTGTNIVFCYGKKEYKKYCKKRFNLINEFDSFAASTEFLNQKKVNYEIVVGVSKISDVYILKSAIVHELSHSVSQWMEYFGFNCDELRSYTLQYLYLEVMPFVDEIVLKKYNVSVEKKKEDVK
jgi:hypothetical protein